MILALIVLAALLQAYADAASATGLLLSSQFYCEAPCDEKMGFYLSATSGAEAPRRLQMYLPSAPKSERAFTSFSAFDPDTNVFTTIAADYPKESMSTIWVSTVSGNDLESMQASPLYEGIVANHPLSSSPSPLNNIKLKVAKIVAGPNGMILTIFTNGEIHSLDTKNGIFTLMHKLIPDNRALDLDFPTTSSAHAFDFTRNGLWSVVSAGISAYLVFTDFSTKQVGDWLQLNANMVLDPGANAVQTDFSPEFFANGFMAESEDGNGLRFMVQLESLDNVGFDLITFVNTTTGYFEGPVYNLMPYNLIFQCFSYNCDMSRVSAFDPKSKTVWFQAHVAEGEESGKTTLNTLTFDKTKKNDVPTYYISVVNTWSDYGYTNFYFYNFEN